MNALLGSGMLALVVSATIVGTRLLALARRTRELPELGFGLAFLSLGAIGYPLSIAARRHVELGFLDAGSLLALGLSFQDLSSLAIAIATWKTFRRDRPALVWAIVALLAVYLVHPVGHALTVGFEGGRDGGPWYYVGFTARAIPYFWTAAEATGYALRLRRRLRIGLGDPVVTDRFRLWAVSSGTIAAGFLVFLAGRLLTDDVTGSAPVLVLTSTIGLVSATAMWMAFVPPGWYLRRIASKARPA